MTLIMLLGGTPVLLHGDELGLDQVTLCISIFIIIEIFSLEENVIVNALGIGWNLQRFYQVLIGWLHSSALSLQSKCESHQCQSTIDFESLLNIRIDWILASRSVRWIKRIDVEILSSFSRTSTERIVSIWSFGNGNRRDIEYLLVYPWSTGTSWLCRKNSVIRFFFSFFTRFVPFRLSLISAKRERKRRISHCIV